MFWLLARLFLAFFLIVFGSVLWASLPAPDVSVPLQVWPRTWDIEIWPISLPAVGIPIGAGLALLLRPWRGSATPGAQPPSETGTDGLADAHSRIPRRPRDGFLTQLSLASALGAATGAVALLITIAVARQPERALVAMLTLVLTAAALFTLAFAISNLMRGGNVEVTSHWGGLGGGTGGWRLSPTAVTILLSVILISSATVLAMSAGGVGQGGNVQQSQEKNPPAARQSNSANQSSSGAGNSAS